MFLNPLASTTIVVCCECLTREGVHKFCYSYSSPLLRAALWPLQDIANILLQYGARARAGGMCRVVVLHEASVIGCWGHAAGAASVTDITVCW